MRTGTYLKEQIIHWYFDTGTYRYFQIMIELVLQLYYWF